MKKWMNQILSFVLLFLLETVSYGQVWSVENLITIISFPSSKFENHLSRKGFAFTGKEVHQDTILSKYDYRSMKNLKVTDSANRSITRADIRDNAFITYETESFAEFSHMKAQLKNAGFYCTHEERADKLSSELYQNKNRWVRSFIKTADNKSRYSLLFHHKIFPRAKDIFYADDLLTFTSHEFLVYYFGEKNVKKDIYFLSGNEIAKCSVLFLNTNRQVVFIWADEENRCTISRLLFGGQQNLQSSLESGKYVEENNWALKSGVRPGMSLLELRMLHGHNFSFYGGNSINSGAIIAGSQGKLDFNKESIVLGCLNCRDDKFSTAKVLNADDSIDEGRILFILSIILNPL